MCMCVCVRVCVCVCVRICVWWGKKISVSNILIFQLVATICIALIALYCDLHANVCLTYIFHKHHVFSPYTESARILNVSRTAYYASWVQSSSGLRPSILNLFIQKFSFYASLIFNISVEVVFCIKLFVCVSRIRIFYIFSVIV